MGQPTTYGECDHRVFQSGRGYNNSPFKKALDPLDHLLLCPTVSMDVDMGGLATFTTKEIIHR